jgi:hypothetical protein
MGFKIQPIDEYRQLTWQESEAWIRESLYAFNTAGEFKLATMGAIINGRVVWPCNNALASFDGTLASVAIEERLEYPEPESASRETLALFCR